MYDDTIAAISTAPGQGGIGIVRLSGPRAGEILSDLFVPYHRRQPAKTPRRLTLGHIVDPETGQRVDEVLAAYLPAPHTYTREDMAEIQGHGGPAALQAILSLCLARGARMASPGEFTARAFLNGRITLDQAEAVVDVIQARTQAGLSLAVQQLDGRLAGQVRAARRAVLDVLAYLTVLVDFPEDEVEPDEALHGLRQARETVERLLATADQGIVYRQGVRAAIVGRPNVGKSSLLNALLRQNRAIVTPVPGTTRDTIEETLQLGGIPVVLVDTAGIASSSDAVEAMGVDRSRQAMATAGLVLLVVDGSAPLTPEDAALAAGLAGRETILAANKCDLPAAAGDAELAALLPGAPLVRLSALTGEGLQRLEETVAAALLGGRVDAGEGWLVSSPRHADALRRAAAHLASAEDALLHVDAADLATIDLTAAANALGEITGETAGDDLLDAIFSRFCIGK